MAAKGKKATQRKLTAILCTDVVGYSRLMGDDESATIETLASGVLSGNYLSIRH